MTKRLESSKRILIGWAWTTKRCIVNSSVFLNIRWRLKEVFWILFVEKEGVFEHQSDSRKCVIPVVCVKLGKLYVVKHNCVTWGVFNVYIPHPRPLEPPTTQHNWGEGRWTGLRTSTELHTCRAHPHNSFIFLYLFLFCVFFISFLFFILFLLIRPVCRDLYTTCACMPIVRS